MIGLTDRDLRRIGRFVRTHPGRPEPDASTPADATDAAEDDPDEAG